MSDQWLFDDHAGACEVQRRLTCRNKRGIAGSLIWINFDRHALLALFAKAGATFVADKDEIRPRYQSATSGDAVFSLTLVRDLVAG